jgi:hypothetical protein
VSFEAVVKGLQQYFLNRIRLRGPSGASGKWSSSLVEFTRRASASIARVCGMSLDRARMELGCGCRRS